MEITSLTGQRLKEMFDLMLDYFGKQNWWPAETELEMIVGAILTQNTNWKNVEKAIQNLKRKELLSLSRLQKISKSELAEEIRPAGYYNLKTKRLKNLVDFIVDNYGTDLDLFLNDKAESLREGLLSVKGVGPETADSILLYAIGRPVFVIDTYTHRVLVRHQMAEPESSYDELQELFMDNLPSDVDLFNEFHALIVLTGKNYCKKKPICERCPLGKWELKPSFVE